MQLGEYQTSLSIVLDGTHYRRIELGRHLGDPNPSVAWASLHPKWGRVPIPPEDSGQLEHTYQQTVATETTAFRHIGVPRATETTNTSHL